MNLSKADYGIGFYYFKGKSEGEFLEKGKDLELR